MIEVAIVLNHLNVVFDNIVQQCCNFFVSECRWEGMSRAKHWCSSQQFPLDHLNSADACNKMHKQQFLHAINPDTWKSADRLQLPPVQWDHQSSSKYGATWLTCQCRIPTCCWILLHADWWSNNGNRPMLMLGPWKNCPEGIWLLLGQDESCFGVWQHIL